MKNILPIVVAILATGNLFSQNNWCGMDEYNNQIMQEMSSAEAEKFESSRLKFIQEAQFIGQQKSESGTVYTIPVVIHVLHDNCVNNLSNEQIQDGLRIINEDFRRINSDTSDTRALFKSLAQDAEIEFVLAKKDPNGDCTSGIVKYNTTDTYNADDNIKIASRRWPYNKYLNIWLVESIDLGNGNSTLGYAKFPYKWGGNSYWNSYGLVVRGDAWGTIGTSSADGRTGTHEIGHCLGLPHTFGDENCGGSCTNSGDGICDTPPQYEASWHCQKSANTCSNDATGGNTNNPNPFSSDVPDMIENYMSYNSCQNMYTQGQVNVMRGYLDNSDFPQLRNLVSSANLVATGTNPGYVPVACKPDPYFCQDYVQVCSYSSITFIDRTDRGQGTSRSWSFPGGIPASSSDSIVTVTYENGGKYDVSLTVGNSAGSETYLKENAVTIDPIDARFSHWRYDEDFEDKDAFDTNWTIKDDGVGRKWEHTSASSYDGSNSVFIQNYINADGYIDDLISPSFDMTAVTDPHLTFQIAYARKNASSLDILRVYYSFDCGNNWNFVGVITGQLMESIPDFRTDEFFPADQSEWKLVDFRISSIAHSKENVRLKFEFQSGGGNNLFIDDINITNLSGIEENDVFDQIAIYPNPASESIYFELNELQSKVNRIVIRDVSGRMVNHLANDQISAVSGPVRLDVSNLESGIYFAEISTTGNQRTVRKFIVN